MIKAKAKESRKPVFKSRVNTESWLLTFTITIIVLQYQIPLQYPVYRLLYCIMYYIIIIKYRVKVKVTVL